MRMCIAQGRMQGREIVEVSVLANENARRVRGTVKECENCGRVLLASNMARHLRCCRVWDPGGDPNP